MSHDFSWVVDAYTLPLAAIMLTAGTLVDRFRRKRLFLIGLGLFVLGSLLCGVAPKLGWLLVGRAVQGLGAAALMPGSRAVLVAAFSEPRARAGHWPVGLAAGPLVGGVLIQLPSRLRGRRKNHAQLCWLLVVSVDQNWPVRTPHPAPCSLPIPYRKSTI